MNAPECLRCSTQMEIGVTIDNTHGANLQPKWTDGIPEIRFFTGLVLKGKTKHPISTYRCPSCGYLESYAIEAEKK
jgi:hypothetical protein